MNLLPAELHLEIISYLSPQDYTNYRLISTRCADIGASLVFSTFHFNAAVHSINRMNQIVNKPFAQHIKSLHYNDDNGRTGRKYGYTSAFNIHLLTVLETLTQAGAPLSRLTTQCLPYWFFAPGAFHLQSLSHAYATFTHVTLHLRWYVSEVYVFGDVMHSGTLRAFLERLEFLQEFTLSFGPETKVGGGEVGYRGSMYSGPRPRVGDVLPLCRTWMQLRKLELWFVSATVRELIALLRSCASTVQELDLAGVALCEKDGRVMRAGGKRMKEAWQRVVREFKGFEDLRRVSLRERTRNTALDRRGWCVEGGMGKVVLETDLYRYLEEGG